MLLAIGMAFAQNQRKTDSLEKQLTCRIPDTTRCRIMSILCEEYMRIDKKKARYYNNQSMLLSVSCGYKRGIASGFYDKAILMKYMGRNDSAIKLLKTSGTLYLQLPDTLNYLNCRAETGAVCLAGQDYQQAMECFLEAEKGYARIKSRQNLARIYSQLGSLYKAQKLTDEALKYHQRSLMINKELNFKLGISVNLNNIGNIFDERKNYDSARYYYHKALEIKELLKDNLGIARTLNNLGMVFLNMGDVKNALQYHLKALVINQEANNKKDLAINYANLGYDYLKANEFPRAAYNASQSLKLATDIHDLTLLSESYKILNEAAAGTGEYKKALRYYQLHKQYYDSVINEKNRNAIAEIRARYDVVKNETMIAELNSLKKDQELRMETIKANRNLYLSLLIGVMFILLAFYMWIRSRKKIELHLQEVNHVKSKFFANLSHEFRTPLSLMLGPVEKLLENADAEERVLLEIIRRNAKRVLTLDEQLLELTRLETGNHKLKLTQGEISLVIKGIAGSFQSLAERKSINYTCEILLNDTTAIFDADILEKVINNLLSNAFKYTPGGGNISVSATFVNSSDVSGMKVFQKKIRSRYIRIDIQDSGIGIPEKYHDKIFDRFFQISDGKEYGREGTGIGLALTKELVELSHGVITLNSREGQGSLFTVFLPVEKEVFSPNDTAEITAYKETPAMALQPTVYQGHSPVKPPHDPIEKTGEQTVAQVLVVEDNPDMRRYLRVLLSGIYSVAEAAEGAEGFRMACENHPDLIITDLMMPGIDGMEFCAKIKGEVCTSHIPLIMLTALASTEDKITGLETGADDYIGKPFSNSELLARIRNLISQREHLRNLFCTEMRLQPGDVTVTPVDERFLQRLIKSIEDHIENPEIDIDFLTKSASMSRSRLHMKLKALTGMSATGFVKIIRLKRAVNLMDQHYGNVSEIAYAVGFTNLSYFTKCFREVYGELPSDYLKKRMIGCST